MVPSFRHGAVAFQLYTPPDRATKVMQRLMLAVALLLGRVHALHVSWEDACSRIVSQRQGPVCKRRSNPKYKRRKKTSLGVIRGLPLLMKTLQVVKKDVLKPSIFRCNQSAWDSAVRTSARPQYTEEVARLREVHRPLYSWLVCTLKHGFALPRHFDYRPSPSRH